MNRVQPGDVLVADMTDPDWEPVMKRAAAIVTNRGGRTCHAAIIARELGVPAVVGTGNALDLIEDGMEVKVSCAEGDTGFIYAGTLPFERIPTDLSHMPDAPLNTIMNVATPQREFTFGPLPHTRTTRGGRTCHAAIIARELGVPAVVGTGNALDLIEDGMEVTVSCAEGDTGFIYAGTLPFERITTDLSHMPEAPLKIMMNVANPERAFDFGQLPNAGIGLARLEMIIAAHIGVHPNALLQYDRQDAATKKKIDEKSAGYADPVSFYVDRLAEGIATLTASVAPNPVIVRLSDFKSNEYANLIGGENFEPHEENPMIGFRGASRYVDPSFADAFALECKAVRKVRDEMGLDNLWVMIPFVRTLDEGRKVVEVLESNGLKQGQDRKSVVAGTRVSG